MAVVGEGVLRLRKYVRLRHLFGVWFVCLSLVYRVCAVVFFGVRLCTYCIRRRILSVCVAGFVAAFMTKRITISFMLLHHFYF